MREFRARRLSDATARVREAHPTKASAIENGGGLDSAVGQILLRKLRSATDVNALIDSLTAIERRLVGALLAHPDDDVRRSVFAIARQREDLITTRQLWRGYQSERNRQRREPLRELLSRRDLLPLQQFLVRPTDELLWFFDAVMNQGLTFDDACDRANLLPGPLRDQLVAEGIAAGFLEVWKVLGTETLRDGLETQYRDDVVRTWEAFAHNYGNSAPSKLVENPLVLVFLEVVQAHRRTLDQVDPETRHFLTTLLTWAELKNFFAGDNDRFSYWSKYADRMVDVFVERREEALLMDFGHFGVVEFAEVGNAAYVYGADYFERLREWRAQGRRPLLKDQLNAIRRIIHRSGWKGSTDRFMREQGVWRGFL